MTWCRRAALLLLPFLVLVSIPELTHVGCPDHGSREIPPAVRRRARTQPYPALQPGADPDARRGVAVCGCVSAGRERAVSSHRLENAI